MQYNAKRRHWRRTKLGIWTSCRLFVSCVILLAYHQSASCIMRHSIIAIISHRSNSLGGTRRSIFPVFYCGIGWTWDLDWIQRKGFSIRVTSINLVAAVRLLRSCIEHRDAEPSFAAEPASHCFSPLSSTLTEDFMGSSIDERVLSVIVYGEKVKLEADWLGITRFRRIEMGTLLQRGAPSASKRSLPWK